MEVLAKRLKWLREKERYAQKDIAKKIGMTPSGYQKIEYGERDPKLDVLVQLCNIFNVSADFLLGRNNDTNILKELTYQIFNYESQLIYLRNELSHISLTQAEVQEEIKQLKTDPTIIIDKEYAGGLPRRDDVRRNPLKYKEQILISILERKVETEAELHVIHKERNLLLNKYIIELLELPDSNPSQDDILNKYLPIKMEIQPDSFNHFSISLYGKEIGFFGHYGNYETIDEIKKEIEKLSRLLNGNSQN